MKKSELKKVLKQYQLTEQDIDTFNEKRVFYTFSEYKNELFIHVGKELTFCMNFKKAKANDYFSYSAICANGNELQMNLDRCYSILKKYLDTELSEDRIVEFIK